jgi:hypothetical protein
MLRISYSLIFGFQRYIHFKKVEGKPAQYFIDCDAERREQEKEKRRERKEAEGGGSGGSRSAKQKEKLRRELQKEGAAPIIEEDSPYPWPRSGH